MLLHWDRHDAERALTLGVMELIVRRNLQLVKIEVEQPTLWRQRTVSIAVLARANAADSVHLLPSTVQPLWAAYLEQCQNETVGWRPGAHRWHEDPISGVSVRDFARGVARVLGTSGSRQTSHRYLDECVRPVLYSRSWVDEESYRTLRLFSRTRWVLTSAGVAAQGDLRRMVEYGNRVLGRLVDEEPERARLFLSLAGAAILLMYEGYPHLRKLPEGLTEATYPLSPVRDIGLDFLYSELDTLDTGLSDFYPELEAAARRGQHGGGSTSRRAYGAWNV